jgi:hypothetical protein
VEASIPKKSEEPKVTPGLSKPKTAPKKQASLAVKPIKRIKKDKITSPSQPKKRKEVTIDNFM